jgi:hypothetical protein
MRLFGIEQGRGVAAPGRSPTRSLNSPRRQEYMSDAAYLLMASP